MNKFYFLITSILCVLMAHGEKISHSVYINPNDVEWMDSTMNGIQYVLPKIKGAENQAEYGQPSLPKILVSFALPPNATDISITEISTEKYGTKSLGNPILPFMPGLASLQKNVNTAIDGYANKDNIHTKRIVENELDLPKIPVIIDHRQGINKSKKKDTYYPLLEEGKEWRYTMYNATSKMYPNSHFGPIEVNRVIRLEDPIEIDGEIYLQANAYYDDEHQDDSLNPMAYLREDTVNKQVIMKINNSGENYFYEDYFTSAMYLMLRDGVLYDFKDPLNGYFADQCQLAGEDPFECIDGMHNRYRLSFGGVEYEMVEGIGYLLLTKEYRTCDLFGTAYSNIPSILEWCYYPYLYEVAKADGTIIYRNPDYAPGWTSTASVISDGEVRVSIDAEEIKVHCPDDAAELALYNIQGIKVVKGVCASGEVSLSTLGLAKGVYILQCGSYVQKVTLK